MKLLKNMPKPKALVKHSGHLVQQNSPTILSALAVLGVAGTAYLTWKAARQHEEIIRHENKVLQVSTGDDKAKLTREAEFVRVWKLYMPAAGVAATTIFCIVASNRIAMRRLAALGAAYGVLSGDLEEYRAKAREMLGEKKADKLDADVSEKKMKDVKLPEASLLQPGQSWFVDLSTGRPFPSTRETVQKGVNELNYELLHGGNHCASLNAAYSHVGLPVVQVGDMLGWEGDVQIEVSYVPVFMDDGQTATGIKFLPEPKPDFDDLH